VRGIEPKNILVVRTDRIGDVVLTLPVVDVLRRAYPDSTISFLARAYTKDILVGQEGIDAILSYDEPKAKSFFQMLSKLRNAKFDLAVVAFPRFRIALLLWLAGVKTRVGTGYRWYSILFSKRVFEHRKTAEKHEFEYDLSLLRHLGLVVPTSIRPNITIPKRAVEIAEEERRRLRLSDQESFVIIHPGSGGSARDWSPSNFSALATELRGAGLQVVVTGAQGEERLVDRVLSGTHGTVKSSVGRLGLKELAAFIRSADLFVSNSTGPLHIAAAVGTPVIGFYPPIRACSPERWGPVTEKKVVFVPDRLKCELCRGGPCRGSVCMDQIRVGQVVDAAKKLMSEQVRSLDTRVHS
jgi:heptosyltransferase III